MGYERDYKLYLIEEIKKLEKRIDLTTSRATKDNLKKEIQILRSRVKKNVRHSCYGRDI